MEWKNCCDTCKFYENNVELGDEYCLIPDVPNCGNWKDREAPDVEKTDNA